MVIQGWGGGPQDVVIASWAACHEASAAAAAWRRCTWIARHSVVECTIGIAIAHIASCQCQAPSASAETGVSECLLPATSPRHAPGLALRPGAWPGRARKLGGRPPGQRRRAHPAGAAARRRRLRLARPAAGRRLLAWRPKVGGKDACVKLGAAARAGASTPSRRSTGACAACPTTAQPTACPPPARQLAALHLHRGSAAAHPGRLICRRRLPAVAWGRGGRCGRVCGCT